MRRFTPAVDPGRVAAVRARVAAFDWAAMPRIPGWEAGIDLDFLRRICDHWITAWSATDFERRIGRHPQFVTEVDGQRLHLIRAVPERPSDRPPVLLLNGWPGTCYEFDEVVAALVADGVEVVVPSLPGYGHSTPLPAPIGPRAVAAMMDRLMVEVLGHPAYVVHGMDWGSRIAGWMGIDHPRTCVAVHLGMLTARAEEAAPLDEAGRDWQRRFLAGWNDHNGYHRIQSTRPQTLGVGLSDSPVGVAAWILEKYVAWSRLPGADLGRPDVFAVYTEDQLIDVVMLYLLTGTIVTSTWMYYGNTGDPQAFPGRGVRVPVGVAAFDDPVALVPPRAVAEGAFNIVAWDEMERGGHFPGLEAPDLLASSILGFLDHPAVRAQCPTPPKGS